MPRLEEGPRRNLPADRFLGPPKRVGDDSAGFNAPPAPCLLRTECVLSFCFTVPSARLIPLLPVGDPPAASPPHPPPRPFPAAHPHVPRGKTAKTAAGRRTDTRHCPTHSLPFGSARQGGGGTWRRPPMAVPKASGQVTGKTGNYAWAFPALVPWRSSLPLDVGGACHLLMTRTGKTAPWPPTRRGSPGRSVGSVAMHSPGGSRWLAKSQHGADTVSPAAVISAVSSGVDAPSLEGGDTVTAWWLP